MPSLSESVEEYLVTDEIAGLAKSTKVRTSIVLRDLLKITGPKLSPSRLNRTHVDKCVAAWRKRNLSESSINNYKASLRQFGEYLYETRQVKENPAKHLKTLKTMVNHDKRRALTGEQVRKVAFAASMFHERDRVSVIITVYTGLRASELCALRWKDIDFDKRLIHARRSKVSDVHTVPMSDALVGILTAWKATYETKHKNFDAEMYVVPALLNAPPIPGVTRNSWDLRMNPWVKQGNFRQRLKGYMKIARVPDYQILGVHALRRTAGNLLLDAGADVRDVQQLLGHASERQTQIYLDRDAARDKLAEKVKNWTII